jgi:hypothetical protein
MKSLHGEEEANELFAYVGQNAIADVEGYEERITKIK